MDPTVLTDVVKSPRPVRVAVGLLWASMALGVINGIIDFPSGSRSFMYVVAVVVFAVQALLFFNIAAGRNWARITFLVLFLLGAMMSLPLFLPMFVFAPPAAALLVLLMTFLQAYALVLLFTQPGSGWFRA